MRQKLVLIISIFFSFFLVAYSIAADSTPYPTPDAATIEKAKADFLNGICANHGGVNCSVINYDASIVCNDGSIDTSFPTIYGIPQCQAKLEEINTQQSDFMAQSGCFPPSELRCTNNQSYQNLLKHLSGFGVASSELGRNELNQCQQQITDYNKDLKNYKQCLADHGQPNFELSGKVILPLLKTIFCPIFYGNKASYDQDLDLCTCAKGYFMNNEQCVAAGQICQEKHGANYVSKNGNCVAVTTPAKTTPLISKTPVPSQIILPTTQPRGEDTTTFQQRTSETKFQQETSETLAEKPDEPKPNFIQNIFSSFISGIKKMLRLF